MQCLNRRAGASISVHETLASHRSSRRGCTARRPTQLCSAAVQQPALLYDFHDQLVPYEKAWSWQKQRVKELCTAATADRRDTVFLLQHPPVYTLGAGSSEAHLKFDLQQPPHPLYRTERGGEVTYHGPGQLVMYPILDLTRHKQDLHWYLRGLEEVVVRALADTSGLQGERIEGLTGVWVDGQKLAAIGVRARKWVTYHGLALNVSTALQPFQQITPCGISDRPVGSVKTALARAAAAMAGTAGSESSSSSGGISTSRQQQQQQDDSQPQDDLYAVNNDPLIIEYRYALLEALQEVFGLELQPSSEQQLLDLSSSSSSTNSRSIRSSSNSAGTGAAPLGRGAVAVA